MFINELSKERVKALNKDLNFLKMTRLYEIIALAEKYEVDPTELFELMQYTEQKTIEKRPLDECREDYAKFCNKLLSFAARFITRPKTKK